MAEENQELSLLDRIIQEGKVALDESQRDYAIELVSNFASQIASELKYATL